MRSWKLQNLWNNRRTAGGNGRFFRTALFLRYRRYLIKYIRSDHEVICPEYKTSDGNHIIVVPWFLIPGRPFPIQIYLYACNEYSTNPSHGQRWAAEATRVKYNLKTFSHTTLGRVFKSLEEFQKSAFESRFGDEVKSERNTNPSSAINTIKITNDEHKAPIEKQRFPSVGDTAERRVLMSNFLRLFNKAAEGGNIGAASNEFVTYWYDKTRRLLLWFCAAPDNCVKLFLLKRKELMQFEQEKECRMHHWYPANWKKIQI